MTDIQRQFLEHDSKYTLKAGVKVVVLSTDNKLLLLRRNPHVEWMSRKGGWDFPGGEVDFKEQPIDAVTREVREETNLKIENIQILTAQTLVNNKNDHVIILGYSAIANSQEVTLSIEHDKYVWESFDNLENYKLPDVHLSILESI